MTSLLERRPGADPEPEVTRVTIPRPHTPGVPWWAGVYGLDPAIPVEDDGVDLAAQCTGMACAEHVFGAAAGYPVRVLSRTIPAARLTAWLLESASAEGATRRRLALRLTCGQDRAPDVDRILDDAQHLHDACSPGRR